MCSAKNVHDRPGQWVFVLYALLSGLAVQKGGSYFAACPCLHTYTPLGHFYYILPIRTWAQILTDWTSFYDPRLHQPLTIRLDSFCMLVKL